MIAALDRLDDEYDTLRAALAASIDDGYPSRGCAWRWRSGSSGLSAVGSILKRQRR
jgi:hypothetical protein